MILEVATFDILPGAQRDFESVLPEASAVIAAADGYGSHEFRRGIETDTRYLLFVEWQSVAHHTVGFRESEAFTQWRAILSPYFASPPVAEHYELVLAYPPGASDLGSTP